MDSWVGALHNWEILWQAAYACPSLHQVGLLWGMCFQMINWLPKNVFVFIIVQRGLGRCFQQHPSGKTILRHNHKVVLGTKPGPVCSPPPLENPLNKYNRFSAVDINASHANVRARILSTASALRCHISRRSLSCFAIIYATILELSFSLLTKSPMLSRAWWVSHHRRKN